MLLNKSYFLYILSCVLIFNATYGTTLIEIVGSAIIAIIYS